MGVQVGKKSSGYLGKIIATLAVLIILVAGLGFGNAILQEPERRF